MSLKDEIWGHHLLIDLKGCAQVHITNKEYIQFYVDKLCHLIEMKPFGECHVIHFGDDEKVAGFSMVQLIETSLISGHFVNSDKRAFIDIFSCKIFDINLAAKFTKNTFDATEMKIDYVLRK